MTRRNILFICGGAFDGIDKIIEKREGAKAPWASARKLRARKTATWARCCEDIRPEDLLKFGLIPEFVGRLPIIVTLDNLDEDALVRILTEPTQRPLPPVQQADGDGRRGSGV